MKPLLTFLMLLTLAASVGACEKITITCSNVRHRHLIDLRGGTLHFGGQCPPAREFTVDTVLTCPDCMELKIHEPRLVSKRWTPAELKILDCWLKYGGHDQADDFDSLVWSGMGILIYELKPCTRCGWQASGDDSTSPRCRDSVKTPTYSIQDDTLTIIWENLIDTVFDTVYVRINCCKMRRAIEIKLDSVLARLRRF
jgi:hypothetical protein